MPNWLRPKLRGRLVGLFQINIVLGILLAYFSNYLIGGLGLGANEWRWEFGVAALPAVLFLVMLFGIPPSSRWLVTQKRVEEARAVLVSMGAEDPETELREIVESVHLERAQTSEPLFVWKYRLPIFLAITIGMFNQLSGINAILYYLNDIFAAAGFSKVSGDLQAVAIGAMNLVATLIGMSLIDKLGRKTLLIIGSVGTALCLAGVAKVFYTQTHQNYLIWLLVSYIAFFAVSQGAVIWVYIGEVFPNRVRAKGQSLGSSSHWIMNAIIAYTFPQMAKSLGRLPIYVFCGDDGGAILRGAVPLSGDQGRDAGTDAAQTRHRVAAGDFASLIAESYHRVHSHRSPRRDVARGQRNRRQQERHGHKRCRIR